MSRETIIQVGHSRDGGRYFTQGAAAKGWDLVLVETEAGGPSIAWGERLGGPPFATVHQAPEPSGSAVVETVLGAAAGRDVLAVVPGFELFTVAAHRASVALGLEDAAQGPTVERLRRKDLQRAWLADRTPASAQPVHVVCATSGQAQTAASAIGYPVVVKPVDSGGSSGVQLVHDGAELARAFETITSGATLDDGSPSVGLVLVEEFVDGLEHGVQGVVDAAGAVEVISISTKDLRTEGGLFLERRHVLSPPSAHPVLARFAVDVITDLGLRGSAFHMDVRIAGERVVLVEAGARLSGAYIPRALAMAGCDWGTRTLEVVTGGPAGAGPLVGYAGVELLVADAVPRLLHLGPGADGGAAVERIVDLDRVVAGRPGYRDFHDRVGAQLVVGASVDAVTGSLDAWHRR